MNTPNSSEALPPTTGSGLFCECVNWCRDGRDMFSPHHPRCDKYTAPPVDPRFARFGAAMWKYITDQGGDFCGEEISEDVLPIAQAAGLCCRVEYSRELHGHMDADTGDLIWWWGEHIGGQNAGGMAAGADGSPLPAKEKP